MLKKVILKGIKLYQKFFSPIFSTFFNLHCRYYPSCSEYARLAILEWGIFKGSYLALKRFFRCNPFLPGGVDFPPSKNSKNSLKKEKFYG
ncbi:MAG: membrane protein insertion efficiency factor YidD [Caldimicrobium sp.]